MSKRPPDDPSFIKRLLEEVSKQLEQHPLHDEDAHKELIQGLSRNLEHFASQGMPDLTVIFDVDQETAGRRLNPLLDRMERKGETFHARV